MKPGNKLTEVSSEMNDILENFSGNISLGKEEEAGKIEHSFMSNQLNREAYPMGIWYRGCYYVRRNKRWRLIKCLA